MRNRILLILLVLAALAGIIAVVWFILRPVLPGGLAPQPPGSEQQQAEKPFNPTPSLPTPATSTGSSDANSPEERERQAQEALKRTAIDMAARLNTYSNADDFEALRVMQANVDAAFALELQTKRSTLRRDHPSFGVSWGQSTQALSATINSPAPILSATQASVTVQGQTTIEEAGKANIVTQNRVTLTFNRNGNAWTVMGQTIVAGE